MELTRRGRTVVGCWLVLLVGALFFDAAALLYAAAAVGGLLLGAAARFATRIGSVPETLEVSLSADPAAPLVDETSTLTLEIERSDATLPARVEVPLPDAAATTEPLAIDLDEHESASFSEPAEWPVAGTYRVGPPRLVASDALGLFVAGVRCEAETTVRVEAGDPNSVRQGVDGGRLAAALGRHRATDPGPGVQPAKLRRYQPGEEINRIDWKATARLDDVFVVEPDTETHRQTVMLLDHRSSMGVGRNPDTPIAYLRHAALAITHAARDDGDPVGCYAVGDDGVTAEHAPAARASHYAAIEDTIHDLQVSHVRAGGRPTHGSPSAATADAAATSPAGQPTAASTSVPDASTAAGTTPDSSATATAADEGAGDTPSDGSRTDGGTLQADAPRSDGLQPDAPQIDAPTFDEEIAGLGAYRSSLVASRLHGDARFDARTANRLAGRDDDFATRLGPFFADPTEYVHRVDDDPLFAAARTYVERIRGSLWTVIVTDDSRRAELRETVKVARRTNDRVLVVLTPRVCFERASLADFDRAYERYREFEEFRRQLASLNRVDAVQLAPGDRIEAILEAGGDAS